MSIEQVKATFHRALEAADQAEMTIRSAREAGTEALTLAGITVHDSQHGAAQKGLRLAGEAVRETELVRRRLQGAKEATERYLGTLG
ncbi:hypothetical protein AB0J86_34040 [Micromonospora sp. NPDC049559]|uniref:hypothetical protein n=1 Tax=Micromonospora sp. NPDC049559 TaxID=3155923 RepID=UPI00343094C0